MKYDIEAIKRRKELHDRIKKLIYIFLIIMLYNLFKGNTQPIDPKSSVS